MTSWPPPRQVFAEYMPSANNPADSPSCGVFSPPHCYSCGPPYWLRSTTTSLTSMTPSASRSASNLDFARLPPLRPSSLHPTRSSAPPPKAATVLRSRQAPPYPPNLTPTPSTLCPHCTASDRLEQWLPHPDALAPPNSAVPPELQGRVKAVTLQGWAVCRFGLGQGRVWRSGQVTIGGGRGPGTVAGGPP